MRLLLATCAEAASIDGTTNKLSLFSVVEEIQAASFPTMAPSLAFVLLLEKSNDEPNEIDLRIVGTLNSKELFNLPLKGSFEGKRHLRAVANVLGIPLSGPGTLTLIAKHKKKEIGSWPIQVLGVRTPTITEKPPRLESSTREKKRLIKKPAVRKAATKQVQKSLPKTKAKPSKTKTIARQKKPR